VSSTDFSQDVRISEEILKQIADTYRKIRNTFRYLLGNLFDYDRKSHSVKIQDLDIVDHWALSRSYQILQQATQFYERYDFCKIYHLIDQFCTVDLSAFYFDILKDRLYTFPANSKERRATQSVLYEILKILNSVLAPILVFTAEEVWNTDGLLSSGDSSVHLAYWPVPSSQEINPVLESKWELIKDIRSEVLKVLEGLRKDKVIGSALEAKVELFTDNSEIVDALNGLEEDLKKIFIVSQATLRKQSPPWPEGYYQADKVRGLGIVVTKALGLKCQRCWNYSTFVGQDQEHPLLCDRCVEAIHASVAVK
jgi:isoleucyl-tRNA synthetase